MIIAIFLYKRTKQHGERWFYLCTVGFIKMSPLKCEGNHLVSPCKKGKNRFANAINKIGPNWTYLHRLKQSSEALQKNDCSKNN